MTRRYPGSLIRAEPLVPSLSAASGIWSRAEQYQAEADGIWPLLFPFSLDNTDTASNLTPFTTQTFSGLSFGPPPLPGQKRYIVVAITWVGSNSNFVSGTAGGIALTQQVTVPQSFVNCAILTAEVPSGTSGDVVLNFSSSSFGCGISVYRLMNPLSETPDAIRSEVNSDVNSVYTLDINILAGGAAVAAAGWQNGLTTTWSGLTKDSDVDLNTNDFFTAAHGGSAGSPHAITATNADTVIDTTVAVVATWSP